MNARPTRTRGEWLALMEAQRGGHWGDHDMGQVYDATQALVDRWRHLGLWRPGDTVVDVGCGNGRVAIALSDHQVQYLGLDSMQECVDHCRRCFADWPGFRFEHLDVRNDRYSPDGREDGATVQLPAKDGRADAVICESLFTHLSNPEAAANYAKEVYRVLRPGGRAWLTWFRSPPNPVSYGYDRTVYPEWGILNLLRPFEVLHTEGGLTDGHHDQWKMVVARPADG